MTIYQWTDTFATAQENMDFDRHLLQTITQGDTHIRVYEWQTPGITYPERQTPPQSLQSINHGNRPTGGGIVFHCPGDIVLCIILPKPGRYSPKILHDTVSQVATLIQNAFQTLGLNVIQHSPPPEDATPNLAFCKTYFSPNELYYNGSKICGLTLKRYQKNLMIQGIIHLQNAKGWFKDVSPALHPYMSTIQLLGTSKQLQNTLKEILVRKITL